MSDAIEEFFGMMAMRVARTHATRERLKQAEGWTDSEGRWHPVESMSPRYCATVVRFLERRARWLHDGECSEALFMPTPNGEQASYEWEDAMHVLHAQDPVEWLHEQPLVRVLVARAGDTPAGPSRAWLARHPLIAVKRTLRRAVGAS